MRQGFERLVAVSSTDDDDLGITDTVHTVDDWQAAALRRLIDEDKSAVVLTFSDGCSESLCQIFGNDDLLRIHLLVLMVACLLLMLQR